MGTAIQTQPGSYFHIFLFNFLGVGKRFIVALEAFQSFFGFIFVNYVANNKQSSKAMAQHCLNFLRIWQRFLILYFIGSAVL